jgi:hypothetical protein
MNRILILLCNVAAQKAPSWKADWTRRIVLTVNMQALSLFAQSPNDTAGRKEAFGRPVSDGCLRLLAA